MKNKQQRNVAKLYDEVASYYDKKFEIEADYKIPEYLIGLYKKYNFTKGEILDLGCGTGKLKQYLTGSFKYIGIDISPKMILEAEKQGYCTYLGPMESIVKDLEDKSVDHVVVLSSLYFIEEIEDLFKELERVARKSIFVSLENFTYKIITDMRIQGINVYNHSSSIIKNPTEIIEDVFLWKRPSTKEPVFGDIVFKKID